MRKPTDALACWRRTEVQPYIPAERVPCPLCDAALVLRIGPTGPYFSCRCPARPHAAADSGLARPGL